MEKTFDNDKTIDFLKKLTYEITESFEVDVTEISIHKDHFHRVFKAKPTLNIPRYINTIKTITSREIQKNFPEVKLWKGHLCSSYFLAGQVTL
ncbi:transposase [Acidianus manzaensis]|uniref:transposase n=1 Tax=Acidianus manzaensis TaxID=282676 RepID=UPI001F0303FA|nr:transposase [Acidianus manzaensis]